MPYYHIYIAYTDKKGKEERFVSFNRSEEGVKRHVADPYMKNKAFLIGGRLIHPYDIRIIVVFKSKKKFQELILPDGTSPIDSDKTYVVNCFARGKVKGVKSCTWEFITSPPEEKEEPIKAPTEPLRKKEGVFIVHGRDTEPVKELRAMLSKFGLNPIVLHELPSGSMTIIEKLEKYSEDVDFAFAVLTPDDVGCEFNRFQSLLRTATSEYDKKRWFLEETITHELKPRTRQNVLLEFGFFMGKLSRTKVCCLYKGNVDLPSDMQGIVYIHFNNSVNEVRNRIIKELKAAGYEIKI